MNEVTENLPVFRLYVNVIWFQEFDPRVYLKIKLTPFSTLELVSLLLAELCWAAALTDPARAGGGAITPQWSRAPDWAL